MSINAWVAFKYCISPWQADSGCNSLYTWLMSLAMSLAMNLAALCDVEVKMAPVDAVWWVLVKK